LGEFWRAGGGIFEGWRRSFSGLKEEFLADSLTGIRRLFWRQNLSGGRGRVASLQFLIHLFYITSYFRLC